MDQFKTKTEKSWNQRKQKSHFQCDQIGRFFKILGNLISTKRSPNEWQLFWLFRKTSLILHWLDSFRPTFWKIWLLLIQHLVTLVTFQTNPKAARTQMCVFSQKQKMNNVSLASSKNRKEREKQSALLLMLLLLIDLEQINYISKITHSCGRHCKVFLTESSE